MNSNFDTEEYAHREEAAREATEVATSRKPRASFFGFFAYGDAPGAIGGGIGMFQWFSSRKALLDHLAEHLTYQSPGRHDTDPFAVQAAVKRIVEKFRKVDAPLKLLISRLNAQLRTYSQITWIGTLADLKAAKGKYERKLRQDFRDSVDSDRGTLSIQRSEAADFLDFLSEYGF